MRIEDVSGALRRNAEGIYESGLVREFSFLSDGHAKCLQVEDSSFWFHHRNNCIAQLVSTFPYTGTLLDVGGGNGYVSQRLAAEGHDVVLLEPGIEGALNARRHRNLESVVCSTVEDARFAPGAFGAIGMFDVLEHIEDDAGFLRRVAPLLCGDGRLYLTVPCHAWLWSRADIVAGHARRHTLRSLEHVLHGLFTIEYMSYFFWPLVLPQFFLRALPYRLGLGGARNILPKEVEHVTDRGLLSRILLRVLRHETKFIETGRKLPFGSSCIVAARRIDSVS